MAPVPHKEWVAEAMDMRRNLSDRFLTALATTGNVSLAAEAAGVSRERVYRWREEDSAFATAWREAVEVAVDALEAEARRRAMEGVATAVVYGGRLVRDDAGAPLTVQRYSDRLLALLLRAHRPEKYGDQGLIRKDTPHSDEVSFTIRIGERPEKVEPEPIEGDK